MRRRTIVLLFATLIIFNMNLISDQTNWPQFRGPGGLGIAKAGPKLPVEFDQSRYGAADLKIRSLREINEEMFEQLQKI